MAEAPDPQSKASLVGTQLGRYRLESVLGEGGMGVVYAARHQDLGRPAAVKVLNERHERSKDVQVRFLREGQAASRIRHPNVVDVYDVGTDAGRAYLVMELLEGEDLRRFIVREGSLSVERTADLLVPVVSAVAAAHELGIVHRDLKPDNIFLSKERGVLVPKVLDFGISKIAAEQNEASLTGTDALLGSPYYMSPEQAKQAKNIDARSDQYSLGVILYECVTGRRPLEGTSLYQLIQRIVHGDFAPPRQLQPSLPSAFEQLILTAMARDPARRFPSTRALGRALLAFAAERVQANFSEEFTAAGTPMQAFTPPPASRHALELGTTLRESVHAQDTSDPRPRKRVTAMSIGAPLVLLIGVAAAIVRPGSKSVSSEVSSVKAGASVAPSTAVALSPAPSAEATRAPAVEVQKILRSTPPGASVWVAGENVGQTPVPLNVPAGKALDVELRLADFGPEKRHISESDPAEILVRLQQRHATGTRVPKGDRPALAPR